MVGNLGAAPAKGEGEGGFLKGRGESKRRISVLADGSWYENDFEGGLEEEDSSWGEWWCSDWPKDGWGWSQGHVSRAQSAASVTAGGQVVPPRLRSQRRPLWMPKRLLRALQHLSVLEGTHVSVAKPQ
jgi:hypothetical protein